jgi:phage baseplate assembly protein W
MAISKTRRSATWSDVDGQFRKQTDGDIRRMTDVDAVINSLNNIVATLKGTRRMLPEFAQDIHRLLFEPMDDSTARQIAEEVLEGIKTWEPRVDVTRVDITPDYDGNMYRFQMSFAIKSLPEEQKQIEFVLYTI